VRFVSLGYFQRSLHRFGIEEEGGSEISSVMNYCCSICQEGCSWILQMLKRWNFLPALPKDLLESPVSFHLDSSSSP